MKQSTNLSTGAVGNTVQTHLRTAYNVSAQPKLVANWNLNRYTSPTVTNTPSEDTDGYDIESFPISSIVEPLRPSKGIAKAIINQALFAPSYSASDEPRFYISDSEDKFKYWVSPFTTDGAGNFPTHTDSITTARPRVSYDRVVKANKIVIKFENTWATPKTYGVYLKTTLAGSYSQIGGSNPTINNATGTLTLYYNGTAWVSTRPATLVSTNVAGIELRVSAMGPGRKKDGTITTYTNGPQSGDTIPLIETTGYNSFLSVIAIEPYLEMDLTSRLISVSDTFDMSERSELYPIGTITSNTADIVLSNEDGYLNVENTDVNNPFVGLIDSNVEMDLYYIFTISGVQHSVKQFKMYVSGGWKPADDGTVAVSLDDYSKYLKEVKPSAFMIESKTSTELVWRVLDSVGFTDYNIEDEDLTPNTTIPVFWTTGEETVWEILDQLSKETQTAIYFDADGILQVRSREAAFDTTRSIDWNLLGANSGSNLADIIGWTPSGELGANKIEVTYRTAKWKLSRAETPALTKIWEPDTDTLVVRSSPIVREINDSSQYIFVSQKDVKIWPYKSKVQVGGEIIQYEGKEFIYHTYIRAGSGGSVTYSYDIKNKVNVTNEDEYNKYNNLTPEIYRHKNYFTGGLKITEREVWNTTKDTHKVDINNWTGKVVLDLNGSSTVHTNSRGINHKKSQSLLNIQSTNNMNNEHDTFYAVRGGSAQSGYKVYGTRFRLNKDSAASTQVAGIAFALSGTVENGYYAEVRTSNSLTGAGRKVGNEVRIYSQTAGKKKLIGRSAPIAIAKDVWYELDVYHSGSGNDQKISAFINGQRAATATTNSGTAHADSGKFGMFIRGKSNVDFEYIYALASGSLNEPDEDYGFFDLKYGGTRGDHWIREWVWETRTRRKKIKKKNSPKEKYRHNIYMFDEFGPYIHEIREFDVKFDPAPVRYSYLFNTNEWFSANVEYYASPFGAKFIIANTSRDNAVLHGEDRLSYAGASSGLNQVCVVLGQTLEMSDEQTVERKNEAAIRARGEIAVELDAEWIQTESMAEAIADWMHNHWGDQVDEVEVQIFGNPLIEIGDLLDVNYARQNATPATHKYFVVGVNNSFEGGITTSLVLRRMR